LIVLDASVLIAHLRSTDAHHPIARAMLLEHAEEGFAVHRLTLAEVLVGAARKGRERELLEQLVTAGIEVTHPAPDEALELARLRAASGLKLPDCCVLSSALAERHGLATFDRALAAAARERGIRVLPATPAR
jgi:predicted nucleic acid-binding protein